MVIVGTSNTAVMSDNVDFETFCTYLGGVQKTGSNLQGIEHPTNYTHVWDVYYTLMGVFD